MMLRKYVATPVIVLIVWPLCQATTLGAPDVVSPPSATTELRLELPEQLNAASVTATPVGSPAAGTAGKPVTAAVAGKSVPLSLANGVAYNLSLVEASETGGAVTWQGVDMRWYADLPPKREPAPLSDDDRKEIGSIVTGVKDFYNRKSVLAFSGDADRAVALVRLVRDSDFYAGKGQIVWRIELWYFENQAGGWAAVGQQNRILHRERFKDADAYRAATANLRFLPALGGIVAGKSTAIVVTKEQLADAPAGYADPALDKP